MKPTKVRKLKKKKTHLDIKGHHLDLKINGVRVDLPECSRYKEIRFEVQVRSIIQDAWSVLDHKIKYKKSIPPSLKRQINALAALFEIADREFTQIKSTTQELEEGKADMTLVLDLEASKFDVFAFLSAVADEFPEYQFQGFKADGFTQEIVRWKSNITLEEFRRALTENKEKVNNYTAYQASDHGNVLNPFTQIRHMLYLHDKSAFQLVLYESQRENFDKWLASQA